MVEQNLGYSANVSVVGEFEQELLIVVFVAELEGPVGEPHDQDLLVD